MEDEKNPSDVLRAIFAKRVNPAEIYLRHHGVDLTGDGHACECGYVWKVDDYPNTLCPQCGKYLHESCHTEDCENFCPPNGDASYWWRPDPYCRDCEMARIKNGRMKHLESIPVQMREAATGAYWRQDHRYALDHRLAEWIRSGCGKDNSSMRVLYIHGSVGAGKTISAIRAACRAVMDGLAKSFLFVRETELITAAKTLYGDEGAASQRLLRSAKDVDLLFVDEMFARPDAYTEHVSHVLGDMFAARFERKASGLFTSNEVPMWGSVFDQRIRSRFELVAHSEKVVAPDMRKTHAERIHKDTTEVER